MDESTRQTRDRIKQIIIDALGLEGVTLEMIEDDAPLFDPDQGLGLDSVDALELMVVLEKDFGIEVDQEEIDPEVFQTVASLEEFLAARSPAG